MSPANSLTLSDEDLVEIEAFATKEAMRFKRESGNVLQSVRDRGHDAAVDAILERGDDPTAYEINVRTYLRLDRETEVYVKVWPKPPLDELLSELAYATKLYYVAKDRMARLEKDILDARKREAREA